MTDNLLTVQDILKNEKNDETKGIVFIDEQQKESFVSYKNVYTKSLSVLKSIQDYGLKPNDELIVQVEDNESFIYTIWACIMGGIIAVPLPLANKEEDKRKLYNVFRILNNPYIITAEKKPEYLHMEAPEDIEEYKSSCKKMKSRSFLYSEKAQGTAEIFNGKPNDTVLVLFSSGSTGEPKGATLTNENIMTQVKTTKKHLRINSEDKFLTWMPLTHTIGLCIFHMIPMAFSVDQYIMSTNLFVGNPKAWFDKVSEHRATILCSPNFGYKHLLDNLPDSQKCKWDLSCIKVLINAAEPISKRLMDEFYDRMKAFHFKKTAICPGYGMTETCMFMALSAFDKEFNWYSLNRKALYSGNKIEQVSEADANSILIVSEGSIIDCCKIRICADDGEILGENVIGNIEVIGKCVMPGYYNNPVQNKKAFTGDGWFITGDLGFIKDGELVITGRSKDVIISNGQNFYAYDIERVAQGVDGVKTAAICSVIDKANQKEAVVSFLQYFGDLKKFLSISSEVKKRVSTKTGLEIKYVLPVHQIPKTGSGKIKRFKLKEMFLNGEFNSIKLQLKKLRSRTGHENHTAPTNALQQKLVDIFMQVLDGRQIGIDDDFFEYGGNSLNVVAVLAKFNAAGLHIRPKDFIEHPTVRELCKVAEIDHEDDKEDEIVTGELPLLPNHALLDVRNLYGDVNHWNIGIIVKIFPVPSKEQIEHVIASLLKYHDGLRLRIYKDGTEWKQYIDSMPQHLPISYYDYSGIAKHQQKGQIEMVAEKLQHETNLSKLPVRFAVFYLGDDQPSRILTLIHHGIADGYSMSLFGQDFCRAFAMEMRKEKIAFPHKTTSLKKWCEYLKKYAQSQDMRKELDYWTIAAKNPVQNIPVDYPDQLNNNLYHYERVLSKCLLSSDKTHVLFGKILGRGLELNDVVVTAILRGLKKWTGYQKFLIDYVFNGRYPFDNAIDLSRTIGWMNYFVPLYMDIEGNKTMAQSFRYVKNRLHNIPNHGMGYGGLRYLCDDAEIKKQMEKIPFPEITYNYFNAQTIDESFTDKKYGYIKPAKESAGENEGEYINRGRLIDFVIANRKDGLFCQLHYSCNIHKEKTMNALFYDVKEEMDTLFDKLFLQSKEKQFSLLLGNSSLPQRKPQIQ